MYTSYQSTDTSGRTKLHIVIYLLLELIFSVLIIVSLSITWFNYCLWEFEVVDVEFIDDDFRGFDNPDNISDILDDSCDDSEDYLDLLCPDFCDNADQIKSANDAIIVLSTFSLIIMVVTILLYAVRLCTEKLKFKIVPFIALLQAPVYLFGMILYGAIGKFTEFDDNNCGDVSGSYDCDDYEVKGGLGLAIFIVIALVPVNVYGFWFTRKAFFD